MAYTCKEDQSCFHCGLKSHVIGDCPALLRGEEQSENGKAALLRFHDARKKWRKEHGKKKKPKSNIHQYLAAKEYLHNLSLREDFEKNEFNDPVEVYKIHPQENCSPARIQKAAREFFFYIHTIFLQELISMFERIDDTVDHNDIVRTYRHKNENNPWVQDLNEAVRNGIPADFSDIAKNRYYTIQKSETRTRYLSILLMDDNDICRQVRDLLTDCLNGKKRKIHVCSLGGGPGYDHVAIWIVFLFVYNMNKGIIDDGQITLNTDVFDLYGEWSSIVDSVDQSLASALKTISNSDRCNDIRSNLFTGNGARTKLCDIREGLDSPVNTALSESLRDADIIFFSFVIHENSSIILSKDEDDTFIQGASRDIMERSRVGTIIICTDSNNTCWPSFKATAKFFGWEYFGSYERGSRISLGPKEFVVFRRICEGTGLPE